MRVKVCDQVIIENFIFRVAQRGDAATVISAVTLPRLSCHLQHDDGNDGVATGAVVQDQVASFPGRKNLINVDLGGSFRWWVGRWLS